ATATFRCVRSRALGRRRGGYLLGDPAVALEIVDRVVDASRGEVPVTVKMRRGTDDSAAAEAQFFEILDGAFERGITGVTVHGRTVVQRYKGPSRQEFLAKVKRHVGERLVLGSGDLFSPFDVVGMLERTGIDGVTLARGCIGNPWLFGQVRDVLAGREPRPPSVGEQRNALELHKRCAFAHYGDKRGMPKLRTHAIKYAAVHPDATAVRDDFVKVRSEADFEAALAKHYADDRAEEISPGLVNLALDAQSLASCSVAGGEGA
ncbi:MAG: tRNA-dihydrouridine synthase, partial [Planctomycetes bacterium]|nr:tRNA-dihydrouridine synthase [Planctomycetota bacterium]